MTQTFFIGVDGGATKCIVRIEDEAGRLVGREISGPANIRLSVDQAWSSIHSAVKNILQPLGISLSEKQYRFHAGMGLAGYEIESAYQAFLKHSHSFDTLIVSSDAHVACLGAHDGHDGAIIIIGTGTVGFQIESEHITKVGGWGFPHDDEGGGAWLGLNAIQITLQWLDNRLPVSQLAKAVYAHFEEDQERIVVWANQANSTAFAELAPIVIKQCEAGDKTAIQLMQKAAAAIDVIGDALERSQLAEKHPLPCALIGGISPFIQSYLTAKLRERLFPCQSTPDAGAILLVRNALTGKATARSTF